MNILIRIGSCGATLAAFCMTAVAATSQFNVTASSIVNYTINGQPDPALTLVRGFTYTFSINVSSIHPFYIKTTSGTGTGNQYNEGVSGQGVTSGIITFAVPTNAPSTLYYQCSNHGGMTGPLNIVDPPEITISSVQVGTNVVIKSTGVDTNTLDLNVSASPELSTNTVWETAAILSNAYENGTNTTTLALPAADAGFFQVQQGFF